MSVRERITDTVSRWTGRKPSCVVCQTPVDRDDAVEVSDGVAHQDCGRAVQGVARTMRGAGQ